MSAAERYAAMPREHLQALLAVPTIEEPTKATIRAVLAGTPEPERREIHVQAPTARGPKPNRTEKRYAEDVLDADGREYGFNRLTFLLAPGVRYRPDYDVWRPGEPLELVEVKGAAFTLRDRMGTGGRTSNRDGRTKFLVAAEMFPMFTWRLVQWKDGRWRTLFHFPAKG